MGSIFASPVFIRLSIKVQRKTEWPWGLLLRLFQYESYCTMKYIIMLYISHWWYQRLTGVGDMIKTWNWKIINLNLQKSKAWSSWTFKHLAHSKFEGLRSRLVKTHPRFRLHIHFWTATVTPIKRFWKPYNFALLHFQNHFSFVSTAFTLYLQ